MVNGNDIYIACGCVEDPLSHALQEGSWLEQNNFCKFDLTTNEWTILEPMEDFVQNCSMRLHKFGDYICAVGRGFFNMFGSRLLQR